MSIETLPPIGLDELTERAALMSRTDRKYLVPSRLVDDLVRALADTLDDGLQVLQIDGRRDFGYRSTYLDTARLESYRGAATGRRRRFKVRVRDYLDTGTSYLEVKTRGARGVAVKERVCRPAGTVERMPALSPEELDFLASRLAWSGPVGQEALRSLAPALLTSYRRTTLLVADEGARVTLDHGLSWSLPACSASRHAASLGDLVVVETKSGSRPGRADRLLWAAGARPVRLSKYATGLALTHALPANRWHRTLTRLRADLSAPSTYALAG